MNDVLLSTLLQKTGKARFVDWAEHCLGNGKTNDIIEKIRIQKEYNYTKKSYETRVHNIKTIIKAGRLSDALMIIIESSRLENAIKNKALNLFEKMNITQDYLQPFVSVGEDRLSYIKIRMGQNGFRKALIQKWKGCSITNYKDVSLLIASHIKPWRLSSSEEKTDPENGLLLLPNLDKLFDRGFISFDQNGCLMISKHLYDTDVFNLSNDMHVKLSNKGNEYMDFHRKNVYLS